MSKKKKDDSIGSAGGMNIDGVPMKAEPLIVQPGTSGFVVAPKRSITCGRHVLMGGDSIAAQHLCADPKVAQDSFAAHIKAGNIVKA